MSGFGYDWGWTKGPGSRFAGEFVGKHFTIPIAHPMRPGEEKIKPREDDIEGTCRDIEKIHMIDTRIQGCDDRS